jgi:hypothetical protein
MLPKAASERLHGFAQRDDVLLKSQSLIGYNAEIGIQDDPEESVASES